VLSRGRPTLKQLLDISKSEAVRKLLESKFLKCSVCYLDFSTLVTHNHASTLQDETYLLRLRRLICRRLHDK
jgi:hypothetical protein